jgi:hypothetical protein
MPQGAFPTNLHNNLYQFIKRSGDFVGNGPRAVPLTSDMENIVI